MLHLFKQIVMIIITIPGCNATLWKWRVEARKRTRFKRWKEFRSQNVESVSYFHIFISLKLASRTK